MPSRVLVALNANDFTSFNKAFRDWVKKAGERQLIELVLTESNSMATLFNSVKSAIEKYQSASVRIHQISNTTNSLCIIKDGISTHTKLLNSIQTMVELNFIHYLNSLWRIRHSKRYSHSMRSIHK